MEKRIFLDYLTDQWGTYVTTYMGMPLEDQVEFMQRQGYASFKDLIAHIIAWWDFAMQMIEVKKHDVDYFFPDINVDEFNAKAVEGAKDFSEEQVLQQFEQTRLKFIEYIQLLKDDQIKQPNIAKQLEIDLFGHLLEHAIKRT